MSRNIHRLVSHIYIISLPRKPLNNSIKLYSRWAHRTPGKVILPFEPKGKGGLKKEKVIELDPGVLKKAQTTVKQHVSEQQKHVANISEHAKEPLPKTMKTFNTEDRNEIIEVDNRPPPPTSTLDPRITKKILTERDEKLKKRKFYLSQKKVFDDNGEIIYEKMFENDGRVSTLLVKMKTKKERLRSGQMMVEGWRLIVDGLEAKCNLKYVVFSRTEELDKIRAFLPKTGVVFFKVPYKDIQMFSDVDTAPGILGIFETPTADNVKRITNPLPLHFICDNIRMAGNLGAILRAAVGAGCQKVLLTKGCVDVWDPKVIRSAAGAHFRLPIHQSIDWEEMPSLLEPTSSIFIADSNAKVSEDDSQAEEENNSQIPVLPYYGVEFASLKHITLVIGGETEGISQDSYALAAQRNGLRLNIPMQQGVDSLNTGMATAVIAFEIRKQLIQAWGKIRHDKIIGLVT